MSDIAEPPVHNQKRQQVNTLLFVGLIVALVIMGEFTVHFYTRSGWRAPNIAVAALAADPQGTIWVVDTNNQLWVAEGVRLLLPGGESTQVPVSGDDKITCLAVDRQGQIWVGTSRGIVTLYDTTKEWKSYLPVGKVDQYGIREMAVDGAGRAWVKSSLGWGVIDPARDDSTFSFQYSHATGFGIDALTIDEQGRVWVIYEDAAIGDRDVRVLGPDGIWQIFIVIRAADYQSFSESIAVDRFGQVWLGAYDKNEVGILGSDGQMTKTYAISGSPEATGTMSPQYLVFDAQDRLWGIDTDLFTLGTDGNLNLYLSKYSGFPDGGIHALVLDRQGQVWIHSHPDRLTTFDLENSYPPVDYGTILFMNIASLISIPTITLWIAWILARTKQAAIDFNSIRDFYIGLLGWFGVCTLLIFGVSLIPFGGPGAASVVQLCAGITIYPLIIALMVLFRKRRWIISGAFSAFAINAIGWLLKYSSLIFVSPINYILIMAPYFWVS